MKTTQEMIAVMQAYIDGKEIEYKRDGDDFWVTTQNPLWDWECYDYRVIEIPKPKFKIGDEIVYKSQAEMPIYKTTKIIGITDYGYTLEISAREQKPAKSSINFDEAQEHLLADEVLWYWEVFSNDYWELYGLRFKTEQDLREYYGLDNSEICKKVLSLGFIIPKEFKNERD